MIGSMRRSAVPALAMLSLAWGSNFLWIKLAIRGFSPAEVTLARLALGAAILLAILAARGAALPRSGRLWVHMIVAALFGNAIPYLLFAVGEQTVGSSTAGMLNATTPLWTAAVALAVGHDQTPGLRQAAGLVIGFGGAILIFAPWRGASGLVSAGAIECVGAAASYGVGFIYMDRYLARRGLSPVVLSAFQLLAASAILAIDLGVTGARVPRLDVSNVASILVLGIVGTGLAYVLNYQVITREGVTVASSVTYLLPVVAITLGVIALGEHITLGDLGGIALILTGVALTRRRGQRRPRPPGQLAGARQDRRQLEERDPRP